MHDPLEIGLLVALTVLAVLTLFQTTRSLQMSETADQELSDIDAALATLNTSVALATAKFSDLANKLQAALDAWMAGDGQKLPLSWSFAEQRNTTEGGVTQELLDQIEAERTRA